MTQRPIVIFSSPRSGSTWLGKIFDSHPDVLYLHEPDLADRGLDLLPVWFGQKPQETERANARAYFQRLLGARSLRATGTLPLFRKRYRGYAAELARRSLIFGFKGLERSGLAQRGSTLRVPDLAQRGAPVTCVIKSVTALGRAEALIAGAPELRPILLVRHPCGYINSMLRGEELGVISTPPEYGRLLNTQAARRLNAQEPALATSEKAERLAWDWLLSNAEAAHIIEAHGGAKVIYEELAGNMFEESKRLFAWAGLSWAPQTHEFLTSSQQSEGEYYSVFRDPAKTIAGWRHRLGSETVAKVRDIVSRDPVGAMFFQED